MPWASASHLSSVLREGQVPSNEAHGPGWCEHEHSNPTGLPPQRPPSTQGHRAHAHVWAAYLSLPRAGLLGPQQLRRVSLPPRLLELWWWGPESLC